MATFVIPYRSNGKSRLGDPEVAWAMLQDVRTVCSALGTAVVADAPGGQGNAVAAALSLVGPGVVAIVNSDVPAVTIEDLRELVGAAPALVAAEDGTTNALALLDRDDFVSLYGRNSAQRFSERLGARYLDLPGLRDDVDSRADLGRIADRVGPRTKRLLEARAA
jgi:2-phospho-L-lactate guanylyltransferase (CobY/MobA/RfbA family)